MWKVKAKVTNETLGRRLPNWENGSVWDLCPADSSPRNSWYTAQDSQDPRLSGENPSLKDKDHLQGEWGILLYAHVEMSVFCPLWQINGLLVIIIFFLLSKDSWHDYSVEMPICWSFVFDLLHRCFKVNRFTSTILMSAWETLTHNQIWNKKLRAILRAFRVKFIGVLLMLLCLEMHSNVLDTCGCLLSLNLMCKLGNMNWIIKNREEKNTLW